MIGDAPRILIVEDDADTRNNLRDILELDGYQIEEARSVAEALDRHDWSTYTAALLDRKLPDGTATDLLPRLKELAPDTAVIVVTGHADVSGAIEALRQGAVDYLLKPIEPDELRSRLGRIAEHRRLELAHRESEQFARSVLDSLGSHIAVLNEAGEILAVNQAWRDFGEANGAHAESIGKGADYLRTCFRSRGEDAATALAFASGVEDVISGKSRFFEMEYPCHAPDRRRWFVGRVTPFQGDNPSRVVVSHVDITQRKESEDRALQAERLAAIGEMVTGLAHESGNALQRGQSCLEMLAREVTDRPRAIDLIAKLQKAQDDLARLYDDVRNFAAPIHLRTIPCDLAELWRLVWSDIEPSRKGRAASLHQTLDITRPNGFFDEPRMGQVFRNLFENALAACPDPVEITIRCSHGELNGQDALRLSIRDNGPGFTAEQKRKAFESFYTTKTKGTGLGLAICRRIVEAHRGTIYLSDHGPGAEFILMLPRGHV